MPAKIASKAKKEELSLHRIEALTDGIFAFAMTLLLLTLDLPKEMINPTNNDVISLYTGQVHDIIRYFLSFALLALFWSIHQRQFHHFRRTDNGHIAITMVMLMFIVFIPFSTSMVSEYPDLSSSEFLFAVNMFIVAVLLDAGWLYGTKVRKLVHNNISKDHISVSARRGLVIPAVSLAAMALAFVEPKICVYLYLLIPVILALPLFKSRQPSPAV